MSYLAFKERMNMFKKNEFERHKLFDRLQVAFVAGFWILFTGALLYHDYNQRQKELMAYKVPTIPDVSSIKSFPKSTPTQKVEGQNRQ